MSRSFKIPIWKDGLPSEHRQFRRKIRRRIKSVVKGIKLLIDKESYELPHPKVLVNDYDWSDFTLDFRGDSENEKYSRK